MLGIEAGKNLVCDIGSTAKEQFAKTIFRCTVIVRDDEVNMQKKVEILATARSAFSCLAVAKEPYTRSLSLHRAVYDTVATLIASCSPVGVCP
jgi:hypothetical protein